MNNNLIVATLQYQLIIKKVITFFVHCYCPKKVEHKKWM